MQIEQVIFEKAECHINNKIAELEVGKVYRVEAETLILKKSTIEEMDTKGILFFVPECGDGYVDIDYEDIIEISEAE